MTRDESLHRIVAGRYRLGRVLGAGAHGTVYMAEDLGRGGSHIALKLVEGLVEGEDPSGAAGILRHFRHPRWASVLDGGWVGDGTWFTAIQYVPGRSLDALEGPHSPDQVYRLLEDGARVLGAMHRAGLIHYDVTPGNLILHEDGVQDHFVLTDGGLANVGAVEGSARGTPLYMAPEVTEAGGHDHRADLYSLGLVAFRMLTGQDAFGADGGAGEVLGRRRRETAPRAVTIRVDTPPALDELLAGLLSRNPNDRPYDAFALLEQIGKAKGEDLAPFLPEEAIAAAEGGSFVGAQPHLERFAAALSPLRARIDAGGGHLAAARAPTIREPVIILQGPPGSGCTRLAHEMFAAARQARIPVLLMSGRETTGDRRGPLRHLVDGMAALGLAPDQEPTPIRLDLGGRGRLGREERSHAVTRAVEQFVRGVQATGKRTPFVLVVQDYPELPVRAQSAIRVLSRHLLAHRENGGSAAAPPVLVVLDIGSADAEEHLVPDAQHPERPLLDLEPLSQAEIAAFANARFRGLEPSATDLVLIEKASEARPGTLAGLLAEGCRREDLRYESGRWSWAVDHVDDYQIERGLAPVHSSALRAATPTLRRLLAYLSLVESPLSEQVLADLDSAFADPTISASPLLRTLCRDDTTYVTTANLALKKSILATLDDPLRLQLATELLAASRTRPDFGSSLDAVRLHAMAGTVAGIAEALNAMFSVWDDLPQATRMEAQPLLHELLSRREEILEQPHHRTRAAQMLEHGTAAHKAAALLAEHVEATDAGGNTLTHVTRALMAAQDYSRALSLLDRTISQLPPGVPCLREALLSRCRLLFNLRREEAARTALKVARLACRPLQELATQDPIQLAQLMMLEAQARALNGSAGGALAALSLARRYARASRSHALLAQIYSNIGIVSHELGLPTAAQARLKRALRLRETLGDVDGALATRNNLARIYQLGGALVKSTSLLQESAALAQRHSLPAALTSALLFLARVYDQQLNTRLAATTLQRAASCTKRYEHVPGMTQTAWELAPIASATGDTATARQMLLQSARAAHQRTTSYSRAMHHFSATLTHLHAGLKEAAARSLRRCLRNEEGLYEAPRGTIPILATLLLRPSESSALESAAGARPPRTSNLRHAYRTRLFLDRVRRSLTRPTTPPLHKFLPLGHGATAASGMDRRILVEATLHTASEREWQGATAALESLERHLALTGERRLLARTLLLRAAAIAPKSDRQSAQLFSRGVGLLSDADSNIASRPQIGLPDELDLASHALAPSATEAHNTRPSRLLDAHALAHLLLLRHGYASAPDDRVASALRRVLGATGRMNAGGGLDDLLGGMTTNIIDITGAERACVVLLDSSGALQMRVARSAATSTTDIGVEDLSRTVIQRVTESRAPFLQHDIFDDQELMGRPSITSLSLRSILCVPMLRGTTLYGVLYADSSEAAAAFDQVDLEVLSLFAEQAAAALETHRLVADLHNSMSELKSMQERLVRGERLRTMGELSSGVAHEFNNLLTSILARVQLIALSELDASLRSDLTLIEKACLDAAAVVRRLQNYTRQQRQAAFTLVDVRDVCHDAVEFLRPLWTTRARHGLPIITVRLRSREGLAVMGVATELREVVTNLLKNAVEALTEGGRVEINAHREGQYIAISVTDNGPGISESIQSRMFEAFFTTKGERGTGLGLCLTRQIVERHGGSLGLISSPGAGARFNVRIPVAQPAPLAESTGRGAVSRPAARRAKVLIVDDDANVREPLVQFLVKSGYDVAQAEDGRAGLRQVLRFKPDLIVSDVAMPHMDGLELCAELKASHTAVAVILMSGHASKMDSTRMQLAGAEALLLKPFALKDMGELIARTLGSAAP